MDSGRITTLFVFFFDLWDSYLYFGSRFSYSLNRFWFTAPSPGRQNRLRFCVNLPHLMTYEIIFLSQKFAAILARKICSIKIMSTILASIYEQITQKYHNMDMQHKFIYKLWIQELLWCKKAQSNENKRVTGIEQMSDFLNEIRVSRYRFLLQFPQYLPFFNFLSGLKAGFWLVQIRRLMTSLSTRRRSENQDGQQLYDELFTCW